MDFRWPHETSTSTSTFHPSNPFADPSPRFPHEHEHELPRRDSEPNTVHTVESVDARDLQSYTDRQAKLPEHTSPVRTSTHENNVNVDEDNVVREKIRDLNIKIRRPSLGNERFVENKNRVVVGEERRGSGGSGKSSSSGRSVKCTPEQCVQFARAVEEWLSGKEPAAISLSPTLQKNEEDMSMDEQLLEFQFSEIAGLTSSGSWTELEEVVSSILRNPALHSSDDDKRLTSVFIKLLDVHLITNNWPAIRSFTTRFDHDTPDSGPVNFLTASSYWFTGKNILAKEFSKKSVEQSRVDASYAATKTEAMALMAEILEAEGKKVEGKFYRSKVPSGWKPALERRRLEVEGGVARSPPASIITTTTTTTSQDVPIVVNENLQQQQQQQQQEQEQPTPVAQTRSITDSTTTLQYRDPIIRSGIPNLYSPTTSIPNPSSPDNPYSVADLIRGYHNPFLPPVQLPTGLLRPKDILRGYPVSFDQSTGRFKSKGYNIIAAFESSIKRRNKLKYQMGNTLFLDPDFPFDKDGKAMKFLGMTPLHFCAKYDEKNYISALVQRGEDINGYSNGGLTPLGIAAERGNDVALQCLLEHGADVNIPERGRSEMTPLRKAVEKGNVSTVGLLLKRGARCDIRDGRGRTAEGIAIANGKRNSGREIVGVFREWERTKGEEGKGPPPYRKEVMGGERVVEEGTVV